jgi:predicted nucleic acid-binding protein
MIVLDASVLVELLLGTRKGRKVAVQIADPTIGLHAPHLADVEVMHVLRRLVRAGEIDGSVAESAIVSLLDLDIERHAHDALLKRVWNLRRNLTAYDAVYVALAESLGALLLTCDERLARAPGLGRTVELVR